MLRLLLIIAVLLPVAAATAAEQLGGYTNMSVDSSHGTQVEYVAANGKSWLWYPGNSVVLPGRWKRQGADMCFAYGANTYNPATGTRGGGWECMPFRLYWGTVDERMKGDIFALQGRGAVPFKLDRERTTLEALLSRVSPGAKAPALEVPVNTPMGQIAMSCASLIANAERSKSDMELAVGTYFHGTFMGKPCVKPDYDRAFALARKAGLSVQPYLKTLRDRAATGNPSAIAALQRLGP
jgi:hypothetical protein